MDKKLARARAIEGIGLDCILAHKGVDEQYDWADQKPRILLKRMLRSLKVPVAVGGGIGGHNVDLIGRMGFSIVVVGRTITGATNPGEAAKDLLRRLAFS